ncbi:MAG: hypothetical protein COB35_11305 [Gammaproteobacteria bacterium]|nr:MAG: hypothetical protein COB35_11305 [Gammaproteobacteria bacterium]
MTVNINDRPLEIVREEVIDQLIMNYSHGQLSYEAFERRLDQAMEGKSPENLKELTEDLSLSVDKKYVDTKKQEMGINFTAGETEELDYVVNIFSSSDRSGAWKVAKEIRSISIFSGSNIDFTDAQFTQPVVRMKMFSVFSGDNIYVPENINIVTKAFCIFGSIDNKAPSNADRNAPTIIIEGFALFSGIDIKVKRTIKEHFVNFADNMKKMFS